MKGLLRRLTKIIQIVGVLDSNPMFLSLQSPAKVYLIERNLILPSFRSLASVAEQRSASITHQRGLAVSNHFPITHLMGLSGNTALCTVEEFARILH